MVSVLVRSRDSSSISDAGKGSTASHGKPKGAGKGLTAWPKADLGPICHLKDQGGSACDPEARLPMKRKRSQEDFSQVTLK